MCAGKPIYEKLEGGTQSFCYFSKGFKWNVTDDESNLVEGSASGWLSTADKNLPTPPIALAGDQIQETLSCRESARGQ